MQQRKIIIGLQEAQKGLTELNFVFFLLLIVSRLVHST